MKNIFQQNKHNFIKEFFFKKNLQVKEPLSPNQIHLSPFVT